MKLSRAVLRMAAVSAVLVGSVVVPATAAQAIPTNCTGIYQGQEWWALCSSGTGEYRAIVKCWNATGTSYVWRYGQWEPSPYGEISVARCDNGWDPSNGTWAVRT